MNQERRPYDTKILSWNKKLDEFENKIKTSGSFFRFIFQEINNREVDDLHQELDKVEAQVRAAVDAFSRRSSSEVNYEYYLSEMSSILLRINNLRNDLLE